MNHSNENLTSLQSFSRNSKSQATSFQDNSDMRKRFHIVDLHERQRQREKVKEKEEDKRRELRRKQKKKILGQLQRKKKQLQQLEQLQKSQAQALDSESKAIVDAKAKMDQDRQKQIQKRILERNNSQLAQTRHKIALKRLENQRNEKNSKQIQADSMRKTHCRTQQNQRLQAVRYTKSMEQKELDKMKQSILIREKQKQNLIKGLSKYGLQEKRSGSCSTPGVIIVSRQNEEDNEAFKRAEEEVQRQKKQEQQKKKIIEINRQKAVERGKEALARTQKQQEYDKYCQEVARQQVKYNLKRVQAGRQNQYTGVKPLTLSQIEANKKIRGEQEFERMFFKGKKIQKNTKIVSKYTTFEGKMKEIPIVKKIIEPKKKKIDYMDQESLIPGVSQGHYSFEEERDWEGKNVIKIDQKNVGLQDELKPIIRETRIQETAKNNFIQTRAPGSKKKAQLSYSQSEDDSDL